VSDRSNLIVQYFSFLVDKYEFVVQDKKYAPEVMGNAYVVFRSPNIGIEVTIDRNQVLIAIGEQSDQRKKWFDFTDVMRYFSPSVGEVYVFPDKTIDNTWEDVIEIQLQRLSSMLRDSCKPILRGELWMKEDIANIKRIRKENMFREFNRAAKDDKK